ncbi:MAG: hypothetical protein JWL77_4581, partial [Chthonomonadaceae bacterium]|nr:hypothetical protein [Chthonomonadaceae bacterium]
MHRHRQFVVLWLVLLMGGITTAHAQQPPTLPEWSPSQALLKKLGGLFSVEGYLLQPPANYKLVIPDTGVPEGVSSYVWLGEERKDKTHPLLMVTLLVPPPEEARKLSPAEV